MASKLPGQIAIDHIDADLLGPLGGVSMGGGEVSHQVGHVIPNFLVIGFESIRTKIFDGFSEILVVQKRIEHLFFEAVDIFFVKGFEKLGLPDVHPV